MQLSGRGVALSVGASMLFAVLPGYVQWLTPLDGVQVFAQRVLWSIPLVLLLVLLAGQTTLLRETFVRLRREPLLLAACPLAAALIGVQWGLFLWAPLAGHMLEVSMGYFLLPLVMVLAGRVLYRESLTGLQWLATLLAGAGVAHEVLRAGGMSWETWLVALGYTAYFVLRRRLATDHLGGHWLDMLLLVPAALWFVARAPSSLGLVAGHQHLWAMVPVLGLVSAVALALYMAASRLLPLGLFGLLSYVEPVLLALVALALGESIGREQWPSYGPIFAAVGVLVLDGALRLGQSQKV